MEKKNKSIRRRVFRRAAYICVGLSIIIFLLFSIFVFNPFESDYHGPLINLLPNESHTVIYIPSCQQLREHLLGWIAWENLRKAHLRKFVDSTQSRELIHALAIGEIMARRKQILEDYEIDILEWKHLSQVFGNEAVFALRLAPDGNRTEFLLLTRVSWKCKLIDGALPYLLPNEIRNEFEINLHGKVHSATLSAKEKLYWRRYRDVQFFSNDESFVEEALSIAHGKKGAFAEIVELRSMHTLSEQGDIVFYLNNASSEKEKQGAIGQLAENFLPLQKVLSYTGSISVKSSGKLEIVFSGNLEEMPACDQDRYARQIEWDLAEILPKNTFACMTYPTDRRRFWVHFREQWPPELREQADPYLDKLNRHYRERDYFAGICSEYLRDEAAIVLSDIDFVKEDLQPFECYPALAIIFKTPQAGKFYHVALRSMETLKDIVIKEEFDQDSKFTFFTKETYGEHEYIRVKYPDTSGGAIKPAIGFWGPYLIFTSHTAFLKEFFDVADGFGNNLAQSINSSEARNIWRREHSCNFFLEPDSFISAIQKIEKQCRQWYVEEGKQNRPKLRREFDFLMEMLRQSQVFRLGLSMFFDVDPVEIRGEIAIPVEIRK